MKILYAFVALGFLYACGSNKQNTEVAPVGHSHVVENFYGEGFEQGKTMSVDQAFEALKSAEKVEGQLIGVVQEVCQAKGCWMTVSDSPDMEQNFFVKFKDYGFFVPMDISGRVVVMNGEAYKSITSVDDLRHFAEDAGKSAEEIAAITEPEEEYKFMATGVYLEPK